MALYKYVTAETAMRILKGSIKFTQPGAFNDPFELLPQFIVPAESEGKEAGFSFCVISPRRKGLDRSHIPGPDKLRSDVHARQIVNSLNDSVGILCLSKNPDSLLMWGHYAKEYSGAIIEFDETHEFFKGLNPVKYQKRRPVYNLSDFVNLQVPIADLCVKPSVWSYEREVRLVRSVKDCNVKHVDGLKLPIITMDLPSECVTSVYMGERMDILQQRSIWELVKHTNIALSFAAVANWEYAFRYDPIKFKGPLIGSPIITPVTAHIFKDDAGELGDIARWFLKEHPMANFVSHRC
ncbi:DUF2971 domain-containing protein [Pseudomonas graminis]|uniref:DUF2971 domain-containing protein n=1 Tax=Pseudomonas graminis TaxID=158627 RepID=A0A1I0HZ55_9PSED|nr:DUF2971 domain-containing protein [Pseudomonas graminis]SET89403.1 Protein of unknown function [Pseudomonas graminis]